MSKGQVRAGFQITERDLEMVRWVGRLRFAEEAQIARRFRMDRRNTRRRLHGLVGSGLLDHRRVFHGQPGAYWATRDGLKATAVRLASAGVDVRTYEHDRLAASTMIELEEEFGAEVIVTERELRSHDATADQPRYGVNRSGQAPARPRDLHYPDLAVNGADGRPLAIEIELTTKGRSRLDSIVSGYIRARHIAGVRYYVTPTTRAGLERAIGRAQANQLFDLRSIKTDRP